MKLKYHLDHPQIKRKKSLGNGSTPSSSGGFMSKVANAIGLGGSQTTSQAEKTGTDRHEGTKGGTGDMRTNFQNLLKKK